LVEKNIKTYVIHAPNIKNSLGISREKNDIIDARLIAEYTSRFQDKLQIWNPDDKNIEELKALESERARYVKTKSQLTQGKSDQEKFMDNSISEYLKSCIDPVIKGLNEAIKKIEKRMKEIITKDSELKESY
jgi:transposase